MPAENLREIIREEVKGMKEELRMIRSMIENFAGYEELSKEEADAVGEAREEIERGEGIDQDRVKKELGL
ncbi:MAG: hypothetical protein QXU32_12540 [Nitrososphaerales archaeon]